MEFKYKVKWSRQFVNGSLKGIMHDSEMRFFNLDDAAKWVAYLHEHVTKPVKAIGGSDYTCHMARIVPIEE